MSPDGRLQFEAYRIRRALITSWNALAKISLI
jgi:hypothetical protein